MAAGWWDQAPDLFESAFAGQQGRTGRQTAYRFGLGLFELDCDDAGLNRRFGELYPEGATPGSTASGPFVRCQVRSLDAPSVAAIRFDDPEALDAIAFCRALFSDRGYVQGPPGPGGWQTIARHETPGAPFIAMNGPRAIADRGQPWQPLVANLGLNRLLRLQRDMLFFHAASVVVHGRGWLLAGPKHSGKTTLSVTLASRGHGFLGDEIAALRLPDSRLLPFRRAASIREGMRASALERRLEEGSFREETFPDGAPRILANMRELFPEAASDDAPLRAIFFLEGFSPRPRAERFAFGRGDFGLLTPLAGSMWAVPSGLRMLQMTRLTREVECWRLNPGAPDETAQFLERLSQGNTH
jgi:hypothetical protein